MRLHVRPASAAGLLIVASLLGACAEQVETSSSTTSDAHADQAIEVKTVAEAEAEARARISEANADEELQRLLDELAADG